MDKKTVELAKSILGSAIGAGTMMVIGNMIAFTTPAGVALVPKLLQHLGGACFSAMLADKTSDWANAKIDEGLEEVEKAVKEVEENEEAEVIEAS